MKSTAAEKIKGKGLRWTRQRRAIMSAIASSEKKHLSAEEIYLISKKVIPTIGLATVYRTLELFCSKGILQKFNLPDESARYELLQEDENTHCHYLCLGCGKIFEVPLPKEMFLDMKNNSIQDFSIVNSSYWHYGYCKNCKSHMKENSH